ncbi:hypothetical protein BGZ73_003972 [Actinomortierella ambigua]|nr:hypothetical protein BGZ73_003972 [Actinomortierella ambigua]
MVSISKTLILTVALATSVSSLVIPRAGPTNAPAEVPVEGNKDPCTVLSSLAPSELQLQHVIDCYRAIPYDQTRDGSFVKNLATLYDNFYVYKDLALTTPGAPFAIPSVDIVADINEIAKRTYTSVYDFHQDLRLAIGRLHDAHSTYGVNCYGYYGFKQPLALYAPVVDGKQSIRVFSDETGENVRDCEVVSIDDEEPFAYLQAWADKNGGFSKDPGVRLNSVLTTTVFDAETRTFRPDFGSFYASLILPEKPTIKYVLSCPAKDGEAPRTVTLEAAFKVLPQKEEMPFNSTESFAASCAQGPLLEDDSSSDDASKLFVPVLPHVEEQQKRARLARRADPSPPPTFEHAVIVGGTKHCGFYQLKKTPSVGIVHISSMMVDEEELVPFLKGLQALARRKVTHIIIDLTNNGGGYVKFASDLVAMFFKTPSVMLGTHVGDLRETAGVLHIGMADAANTTVDTQYEPTSFINDNGVAPMTSEAMYGHAVQYTRGGRTSEYTPLTRLAWNNTFDGLKFPWSNDATKIKILTDGRCGSACGMTTDHFVTKHGVEAYAVGGRQGQPLSMYSFAGASVLSWKTISLFHEALGVAAPMSVQAYAGTFNIPWYEVYSAGDSVPLDYSNERYAAKFRLDFTPANARHRDNLWKTLADAAWQLAK